MGCDLQIIRISRKKMTLFNLQSLQHPVQFKYLVCWPHVQQGNLSSLIEKETQKQQTKESSRNSFHL